MISVLQSPHRLRTKTHAQNKPAGDSDAMNRIPIAVFAGEFDAAKKSFSLKRHNRQLAEVLGVNSDELLLDPSSVLKNINRRDLVRVRQSIVTARANGSERRAEIRLRSKGTMKWIELRAVVHLENNMFVISGCCWDITARKAAERAAFEKQVLETGKLRVQSESLPIGLVVFEPDEKMTITEWNLAAEKIFGYTRSEAVGHSALHLLVRKEDWEHVRAAVRANSDSTQGNVGNACNLRKDGSRIWCRWVNTPMRNPDGEVIASVSLVQDITEQLQNEQRMHLWASVIEQSMEGIMICDASQNIVLVNKAFESITGFSDSDAIGKTPRILHSGRQDKDFYAQMWRSVVTTGQWRGEIWNRRKNGELYVEWLALSAVRDEKGIVSHYIGIFSDITARKETEDRVRKLAHFDALTGLPNRSLLMDRTAQLIAASRRQGHKMAMLFIDLDRFKNINDSMGHEAGDELLKIVGRRLSDFVRASDTVARMGGDEFIIALSHVDDVSSVADIAQNALAAINAPMTINGQDLSVSGSVGICIYPDDAADVSEMIRNSDAAMYRAKSSGRNAYQFYTRDMNDRAMEILATESALRYALQRDEFVVHYQPQIDLFTGALIGIEALIRWNRPGVGFVAPNDFIPIAEERGLIAAIGQWMLRNVVQQAAEWDRLGLPKVTIAVNLSASEFHQRGFVQRVKEIICANNLHPSRIELEITEGVILHDTHATIAILQQLRDFGVKLSIDDFGTGYSSLNYLRRFPIDKIKIDRSFVKEMLSDHGAAGIVRGIIGLANSLDLDVIAEGVENRAQIDFLRNAGCGTAQGFVFSAALPAQFMTQTLARWSPALTDRDTDTTRVSSSTMS